MTLWLTYKLYGTYRHKVEKIKLQPHKRTSSSLSSATMKSTIAITENENIWLRIFLEKLCFMCARIYIIDGTFCECTVYCYSSPHNEFNVKFC